MSAFSRCVHEITRNAGEPLKTGFESIQLANELAANGLWLDESLSPKDIEERFFRGKTERYHALEHTHFATAIVE